VALQKVRQQQKIEELSTVSRKTGVERPKVLVARQAGGVAVSHKTGVEKLATSAGSLSWLVSHETGVES
jgi:flagellar basal body P-ring protein FlgI